MAQASAHVFFSGRVQGVFFRATCVEHSRELGLIGWVRNLPDGRVEAMFEGERDIIEEAINTCRKGPPMAHVDDIEVTWGKATGEFSSFSTRH